MSGRESGATNGALTVIPTYNERENLASIITRVHRACPDMHVLVVDDGSPDGTGQLADELVRADPSDRIHVMHRATKTGLGAAYLAGFHWGISRGYSVLVEMDADGSHAPEQLPRLLDAIDHGADLVIGSRYVPGGEVRDWPLRRRLLSRVANWYSRALLNTGIRDLTSGYRAYRRKVLEDIDLEAVDSKGFCFQIDLAGRAVTHDFVVVEVPITFVERQSGSSKMSAVNIGEGLLRITQLGIRTRRGHPA